MPLWILLVGIILYVGFYRYTNFLVKRRDPRAIRQREWIEKQEQDFRENKERFQRMKIIGYHYSIFNKTQFAILIAVSIAVALFIIDMATHMHMETKIEKRVEYRENIMSQEDLDFFGNSLVVSQEIGKKKLKDICPNGVALIDGQPDNKGLIQCR